MSNGHAIGLKQPASSGQQRKRPGNGNGKSKHLGALNPEEHPEIIIIIASSIEGCHCLQNTKDPKTFASCLAGTGEQHGVRHAMHEEKEGKILVFAKIKVEHNLVTVHGEVHEYRILAQKAAHARNTLRNRA